MNKNKTIFNYLKPHNLVRLDDGNIIQIERVFRYCSIFNKDKYISTHYCPLEFNIDRIEEIFELDDKGDYKLVWRKYNE